MDQFEVEASSTNDPISQGAKDAQNTDYAGGSNSNCNSTKFNGFAVVALDATQAKGADGAVYTDYYTHDSAESNVGMTETLTSPLGKDNGVLIAAT